MTITELLGHMKEIKGWYLDARQGAIRLRSDCSVNHCPITAVHALTSHLDWSEIFYLEAAEDLGLSAEDASLIVDAADWDHPEEDGRPELKTMRRRLLDASDLL
jgi:hypothetical protein